MHLTLIRLGIVAMVLALAACGSPKPSVAYRGSVFIEQPDVIVVRPFAANLDEARKDANLLPGWVLNVRAQQQTPRDVAAGQAAANVISQHVVEVLKARGFPAVSASTAPPATAQTAVITGQFVNARSATEAIRPAVGFRVDEPIETRVQMLQGGQFLGELIIEPRERDAGPAGTDIGRQIADVITHAYVLRGWMAPPAK